MPQSPSSSLLSSGLKGMLLRRGSSYSNTSPNMASIGRSESEQFGSPSASTIGFGTPVLGNVVGASGGGVEPLYGEHS
jgi:hypothetical protein